MSDRLPQKKDVMLALLERAPSVFIHLDPRRDEVRVPAWFKKQPQLVLQVGMNMAIPIPDLSVDDAAVSCTLSFSRSPFFCYVPWQAVFALITEDSKGMVWPEDIPPEVAAQKANAEKQQKRPALRAVDSESKAATEPSATVTEPKPSAESVSRSPEKKKPRRKKKPAKEAPEAPQQKAVDDTPAVSRSAARDQPAGKRPLPPYLRVVK